MPEIVPAPLSRRVLAAGVDLGVFLFVPSAVLGAAVLGAKRADWQPPDVDLKRFRVAMVDGSSRWVSVALPVASSLVQVRTRNWRSPGYKAMHLRRVEVATGEPVGVPRALLSMAVRAAWGQVVKRVNRPRVAKTQAAMPELKELQARLADDREALQRETMRYYEEHGVNPFSACGPSIIGALLPSIPAFFTPRRQGAFDWLAGTIVVVDRPLPAERPRPRPVVQERVVPAPPPSPIEVPLVDRIVNSFCAFGVRVDDIAAADVAGPGLYAVQGSTEAWRALGLGDPPDDRPLYVAKTADARDLQSHFVEATAGQRSPTGQSSLRRSLAALLAPAYGLRGVPRSATQKSFSEYALSGADDARLTAWMRQHLRLVVWPYAGELKDLERDVVLALEPPLNLSFVTSRWTKPVKEARKLLADQARGAAESV